MIGEIGWWLARVVYFNDPATGYECLRSGRHGWAPMNSANLYGGGDGGVGGCVLAHACARVLWHACVRDVFAIYDNKT